MKELREYVRLIQNNDDFMDKKIADIRDGKASTSAPEYTTNNVSNLNKFTVLM